MSRIAYLIGIPGAGKSEITETLKRRIGEPLGIITGNHLLHWVAVRLCPYIKPGHNWDWELWVALARNCDLRSAFRRAILDLVNCQAFPPPAPDRILLAEATILGLSQVREPFEEAMNDAGFSASASRVFWLDVSPETVMERVRERGRTNERWIDMAEVERRHRQYVNCDPKADFRSPDSGETASAIREFLLTPS